jgi:hypothetical protein
VTTGRRHQSGAAQVVTVELGQPEGRGGQMLGLVVLEPVPGGVERRVAQPVGRRQVDHAPDLADQVRHDRHARLVRKTQEHDVVAVDPSGIELLEDQIGVGGGDARVQRAGQGARLRVAGGVAE